MKYRLPAILLMLLVLGCAALPASVSDVDDIPDLAVPAVHSTDTPRQSQAISGLPDVFQDLVLDDLVDHALDENLDIRFSVHRPRTRRSRRTHERSGLSSQRWSSRSTSRFWWEFN
jgi:outer membrane protein TolC